MNTVLERKEEDVMKFIINGRTFDSATSAVIAVSRGINQPDYNNAVGDSEVRYENTLYRTVKGAYFVHSHATEKFVKGGRPVVTDDGIECPSPEAAVKWIVDNSAVVIDATGLPLPDEA
jgi:hypothetical protein